MGRSRTHSAARLPMALLALSLAACTPSAPPAAGRDAAAKPAGAAAQTAPAGAAATSAAPAAARPATGAESPAARPSVPTTPATLKVGTLALTAWAPILIAEDRGYFKELGLTIETEEFANGTAMRPAIVTGQLAAGGGGLNAGTLNL